MSGVLKKPERERQKPRSGKKMGKMTSFLSLFSGISFFYHLLFCSAETLRQELEREKMMKRLLMTELWNSPLVAWRMAWCLLSVFFLRALCAHSSTTHRCVLCSPRSPSLVEANFWLDLYGRSYFRLLSIRVFLLLSIVGTGFGKPRRRKMGKWDSLWVLPVCLC